MLASSAPTTTTLCASCATVDANAPLRRPKPRTSPTPTRPVAWWRSITASFARSRPGSATTRPSRTRRRLLAATVMSWPGRRCRSRARARAGPGRGRTRRRRAARRARVSRTQPGHRRRRERQRRRRRARRPRRPRSRPRRGRTRGRRAATMSAWKPGAIAPSSARPWQRAGCSVAITQRVLGRDPLGHGLAAHRVDVALAHEHVRLAVVGAERAVLGPVAAHQLQQRAQVARVGGLAQQHPEPAAALLERLLPASSTRGRSGCRRPRRRRAPAPVTPGAWPSTCGCSATLASTSGIARDDRREVHHLGDADRPLVAQDARPCRRARAARAATRARSPARTTAPSRRRAAAGPRCASSSQRTPSAPSTLAISCGSQTTAVVPRATTTRANSAGSSLEDSTCTCASIRPGTTKRPARVDPLAAVVAADAGDPAVGDRDVAVEPLAREGREHARARDDEVGLGVAARDGEQARARPPPSRREPRQRAGEHRDAALEVGRRRCTRPGGG